MFSAMLNGPTRVRKRKLSAVNDSTRGESNLIEVTATSDTNPKNPLKMPPFGLPMKKKPVVESANVIMRSTPSPAPPSAKSQSAPNAKAPPAISIFGLPASLTCVTATSL
jgi:hypothetical protein